MGDKMTYHSQGLKGVRPTGETRRETRTWRWCAARSTYDTNPRLDEAAEECKQVAGSREPIETGTALSISREFYDSYRVGSAHKLDGGGMSKEFIEKEGKENGGSRG